MGCGRMFVKQFAKAQEYTDRKKQRIYLNLLNNVFCRVNLPPKQIFLKFKGCTWVVVGCL